MSFHIDGMDELVKALEKAQTKVPNAKKQFLAKEAGVLRGRVMKNTPVDTGLLRGSWKQTPVKENSVTVYDNVYYGPFVEHGHRTRGGRGFVPGRHMLKNALAETKANFVKDGQATYKDFEYQMATVKAITQASDEQMAVLTRRAKELGETTMFKASEVGKAEEFMGMAGWKTEQIDKGLPAVLNLAAASGEELARVSDIVTDSMTAFGLKATDVVKTADGKIVNASDHFSDIMAKLATSANTTVGLAGETAKYSAAVVGSLYSSQSTDDKMRAVEDWAAITGIMANAGIKGSMSGTAQRSMLTRLAGMQQNANAARESLGVDFVYREDEYNDKGELVHQAGQTRRIRDVMEDMRARFQGDFDPEHLLDMTERLEGKEFTKQQRIKLSKMIEDVKAKGGKMTDADKATLTSMLAGQEGMAAWLSVLMASEEDWKNMADAMDTAAGTADKMSKIKMDTLAGDVKTLGSAFEALQLEIFEGSGGAGLRSFTQAITEDIRAFKKSLEDGFDIGDIGGMIAKVATQLKDKFLAFDGVGSILAGGALVMGLKKIFNLTMQIKNAAMTMKDWYRGAATTTPPTVGGGKGGAISQSVGSMVIHANSVVVNGKAVSQGAGSVAGQTGRSGTVAGGGAPSRGGTPPPVSSTMSKLGGAAKIAGGAGLLTLLFGGMDILSTRSTNENRVDEAQSNITRLKEQQAQQQTEYQAAQTAYDTNVGDPEITSDQIAMLCENAEKQRAILENTGKDLATAENTLNDIKKETAKNNNEALFATGGAAVGAATGAAIGSFIPVIGNIAGLVIGAALGYAGSEIGRDFGKNFDFDVLGWITGKNDKTSAGEKPIPKADWKLEDGRMYSQLSSSEKFAYHQNESETDKSSRLAAESAVAEAEHQRFEIETAKKQAAASQRHRQKDASQEEIDAGVVKIAKEEERKRTNWNQPFAGTNTQAPVVASIYGDQTSREMANVTNKEVSNSIGAKIKNEVDFVKSLFSSKDFNNEPNHLGIQQPESTGQRDHLGLDIKKPDQIGTDFWSSVGDFFKNIAEKSSTETNQPNHLGIQQPESTGQRDHLGFEVSEIKMPDFNFSQWWSEKTADMPDFSQMWHDFNISDMLPDFSLSEWISSKTADMPDFSQMWEDFSVSDMLPELNISEWLSQSMPEFDLTSILPDFSTIGTSISETFAQIPTAATEAFNTIATSASEGLSSIQTAWNELPSFFDGLFAGLGGVATAAGAAIASGINSAIGTIQSAWESFSGWLSSKISSLSSMASNAAASIGISIGHNATGTASWRGGFTEVNEQGGEIIDLPSGARIYPHATTMKMLQSDLQAGKLDNLIQSSGFGLNTPATFEYDALGNVKGYSGMADNLIREDDLSPIREAKLQAQRELMSLSAFPQEFQSPELSTFPQAFDVSGLTQGITNNSTTSSTTTNNSTNSGLTVTGGI